MNCFKSDLLDLNRFAGFLAKRLIVILNNTVMDYAVMFYVLVWIYPFFVLYFVKNEETSMKRLIKKYYDMRKIFTLLLLLFLCGFAHAQTTISKSDCSVTVKGKTFPLSGKVKIVESFPDIKVQIVESFPDVEIKLTDSSWPKCCEWKMVESFPDVKIQIVNSFPDIKVKFVNSFPKVVKEKK